MDSADKEKLAKLGESSIKKVFKDALALIEVSGIDKTQYQLIRKQILRSGNDEIRKFHEELEKYDVNYKPTYNEIITIEND